MKTTCTLRLKDAVRAPWYGKGRTLYTCTKSLTLYGGGFIFLTGGSKSGKSTLAESWAVSLAQQSKGPLNYIATLRAGQDPENLRRIALHRAQRAGKGFRSMECPGSVDDLLFRGDGSEVCLLECLGNLVANAMTDAQLWEGRAEDDRKMQQLAADLCASLFRLARRSAQLIVVSNDIYSDAVCYDSGSLLWRKAMAECQSRLLSQENCCAAEVSAGIPLLWKEQRNNGGFDDGESECFP